MVTSVEQRRALNWIDGKFVDSPARQDSINPATYEVIGSYADGGPGAAQAAIDAAFDCFAHKTWRTDGMLRATALAHLADAYQARLDELVDTICLENGKLRPHAHYEVHHIVRSLRFAAGLATQLFGRVLDTEPGLQGMSLRQPVGVAGIISPWNSPAYLSIRSLAPALAAGCTAAMKMPGQAAQTAAIMSEIIASVPEIPAGAVNIFAESHGDGSRLLVDSPRVQTVSFTGSTVVGREIAKSAGAALKRVGLELGGKTPHLVFADADLDLAIPTIVRSLTTFAGQFCMTGSRVLAESSIADQVRTLLADALSSVRLGPATDPDSEMGPMIDKPNVQRVNTEVEEAIAAGAKPVVRGGPTTVPGLTEGAFYHPTLLEVDDSSLPIVQHETFGPVQILQTFDSEDEAVALANDTDYGLSASIWSRDTDRTIRVARLVDAGLISINDWANLAMEFEEGGFKGSGLGRLGGLGSLEDFLEYKQITQRFSATAT